MKLCFELQPYLSFTYCKQDFRARSLQTCFNHLRENDIFLPHDSTIRQLSYCYYTLCEAFNQGKEIRVIICVISKIFDRVWHRGFKLELHAVGTSSSGLDWFEDCVYDLKQRNC